jgi:hypothetical protein
METLMPLAGPELFRPCAASLVPELLDAVRSRAGLLPASYRIIAAMMREADRAGLLLLTAAAAPGGDPAANITSLRTTVDPDAVAAAAAGVAAAEANVSREGALPVGQTMDRACWLACRGFLQDVLLSCRRYRVRPRADLWQGDGVTGDRWPINQAGGVAGDGWLGAFVPSPPSLALP